MIEQIKPISKNLVPDVIAGFTNAFLAIFLSVWATAGRVTDTAICRELAHIIIPLALTLALLTWGVCTFLNPIRE
jgi:hypothetical protein